jgi:hypothetical protein
MKEAEAAHLKEMEKWAQRAAEHWERMDQLGVKLQKLGERMLAFPQKEARRVLETDETGRPCSIQIVKAPRCAKRHLPGMVEAADRLATQALKEAAAANSVQEVDVWDELVPYVSETARVVGGSDTNREAVSGWGKATENAETSAQPFCAGMTRPGALNGNSQTGMKFGSVTGEDRRPHSASFASDHLVDVDPAPKITGLEHRFPRILERGAIGNRTEVPVAVDIAVFIHTGSEPFFLRNAIVNRPDRHLVKGQHRGLQALYRRPLASVVAQPECDLSAFALNWSYRCRSGTVSSTPVVNQWCEGLFPPSYQDHWSARLPCAALNC